MKKNRIDFIVKVGVFAAIAFVLQVIGSMMAIKVSGFFLIIAFVFKSISLPIILVAVIEFAIFINMGIPAYTGTVLPFIASIVIGTIQLGATVDYAILMTTRYRENRLTMDKKTCVVETVKSVTPSILTSGIVMTVVGLLM